MSYTLREMMQTEPFCELQVIAGKEGLDNPVRYVGVLEAPDSVDFVKEHEFVMTTGYVFSSQTEQMLDIIRQLHEHRAAALGIKMFRYIQTLPEEAKKLADEYRLPVFFIPNKYSWHELILPMILNISVMDKDDSGFYRDYDQLIYAMQHSQTIYDFIGRAGELLGKPLTLLNRLTLETLHYPSDYCPPVKETRQWLDLIMAGQEKVQYYQLGGNRAGFLAMELQMPEYQYLILWDSPEPGNMNRFNYFIYSLMLVSESMQNRREMQKNLMLQKGLVLNRIFMEHQKEEGQTAALGITLDPGSLYSPAVLSFEGDADRMEERITIYNPVIVRLLEQLYQKWRIHGFTGAGGQLHLLIPADKKCEGSRELLSASRKVSAAVHRSVQGYFPDLTVRMVTGRPGEGWSGVEKRHEELLSTTAFLNRRSRAPLPPLLHLHDVGMGMFFSSPQAAEFLEDFVGEYFQPVEELEPVMKEKLLEAVKMYVRSGFNTREAARFLGVHHNTIRNRLEQFLNLTGLDLKRSGDLLIFLMYLETSDGVREFT